MQMCCVYVLVCLECLFTYNINKQAYICMLTQHYAVTPNPVLNSEAGQMPARTTAVPAREDLPSPVHVQQ